MSWVMLQKFYDYDPDPDFLPSRAAANEIEQAQAAALQDPDPAPASASAPASKPEQLSLSVGTSREVHRLIQAPAEPSLAPPAGLVSAAAAPHMDDLHDVQGWLSR